MALGYNENAAQEAKKALELSGKLSREDHSLVEAGYYEVNKDWDKAIDVYRTLSNSSPDNIEYGLALANAQIAGERGSDALKSIARLRGLSAAAKEDPRIDMAEAWADYSLSDNKGVVAAPMLGNQKSNGVGSADCCWLGREYFNAALWLVSGNQNRQPPTAKRAGGFSTMLGTWLASLELCMRWPKFPSTRAIWKRQEDYMNKRWRSRGKLATRKPRLENWETSA